MSTMTIKGGNVVGTSGVEKRDIYVVDGKITDKPIKEADVTIDANGKYVFAGLVDMHVHLREPGYERKENIDSGSRAAVRGGFTQVCCMPNTNPVCDCQAVVWHIKSRAKEVGLCKINPIGAATKGLKGEELAEMGKMKQAGIVAVSDDGCPISNAKLARYAIEYASDFDLIYLAHCEDKSLTDDGVVNEGYFSSITGLRGITRVSEELIVAREILLAEHFEKRVHICHVSTAGSVELVRRAKARGVKVSAETCPHYFTLTDEAIIDFNTATKVNPPLRTEEDRLAIVQGIVDGTIDCIATDHAPHHMDDKRVEYQMAAFGISGLETSFAISYTKLVKSGIIGLPKLIELMSTRPSSILKLSGGTLEAGAAADITIADLDRTYRIDSAKFVSRGKNTPFDGMEVSGAITKTIVDGRIVFDEENL